MVDTMPVYPQTIQYVFPKSEENPSNTTAQLLKAVN